MIYELDNVELSFGKGIVLSGIYLKCEKGKITGLLGSNGTGKSSLLRILFGSLRPQQMLLRIDQKAFLKPFFTSGKVKFLSQTGLLPEGMRIQKAFSLYKVDWNEFTVIFPDFKLYKDYRIAQLSGGERRVIEIFLSVKSNAQIVLLDEPFSHIAPLYIEQVKVLVETEKRNKAILLTDHMYRHVLDVSDELYLLKNGCTQPVTEHQDLENYRYLSPNTL